MVKNSHSMTTFVKRSMRSSIPMPRVPSEPLPLLIRILKKAMEVQHTRIRQKAQRFTRLRKTD